MQAARGAAVAPEAPAPDPVRRRTGWVFAVAAIVLAADAISKAVVVARLTEGNPVQAIPHVLRLNLTRNSGAAFSIGPGATILFSAVAVAVVVIIARTARSLVSLGWAVALGLLLGGALGNLADRIFRAPGPFRGHVVDWLELPHWPIFNVADASIVVGGLLAIVLAMRGYELDGTRR
jgi:signal peptidase II